MRVKKREEGIVHRFKNRNTRAANVIQLLDAATRGTSPSPSRIGTFGSHEFHISHLLSFVYLQHYRRVLQNVYHRTFSPNPQNVCSVESFPIADVLDEPADTDERILSM